MTTVRGMRSAYGIAEEFAKAVHAWGNNPANKNDVVSLMLGAETKAETVWILSAVNGGPHTLDDALAVAEAFAAAAERTGLVDKLRPLVTGDVNERQTKTALEVNVPTFARVFCGKKPDLH